MLTDEQLVHARREFREAGEIGRPLLAELTEIAGNLIAYGHLPSSYSPYGRWDEDAGEELLQGWLEKRLLEEGGSSEATSRLRSIEL